MNLGYNAVLGIGFLFSVPIMGQQNHPNILCITCEDISPYIRCFGDSVAVTPNLDKFATEGIRYTRMFTTVGVSAPSRAALITGMYPTAIGANYMRNVSQPMPKDIEPYEVVLPVGVKCYTEYLRAAGYYCTNNEKTDYQFSSPLTAWDELGKTAHWKNRPKGMPFFSIFNLEVTHESRIWGRTKEKLIVDPDKINLPPYYPDDPIVRHDMAVLYSNIYQMDKQFQSLVDELKSSGEWDHTIIIWYSDNGGPLPRQKRTVNESGTLVPFMIRFPDGYRKGEIDDRLCSFPDIPATILSLAGIQPPSYMQGQAFLGKYETSPRSYVYGGRDRMDEQIDKQGFVRDKKFRYIRNYYPEKAGYGVNEYQLNVPLMKRTLELLHKDSLNAAQMRWFTAPRAKEEFYDVENDPHEMRNLIYEDKYQAEISRLRQEYDKWVATYNQNWLIPEQENRSLMWPDGKQPVLNSPLFKQSKNGIEIYSDDAGISIAYQINGKGYSPNHWFLYTEPISIKKGDKITAVAVRAGCKDSEVTEFIAK